jgi:transcription-repair coupling factor (superfamily II helicase)
MRTHPISLPQHYRKRGYGSFHHHGQACLRRCGFRQNRGSNKGLHSRQLPTAGQAAILVPTTILAFQHYKTFTSRLKGVPCTVDYLSRHRKPAEQKKIISDLADGKIDIIIGTHKIAGKDIRFRDLGLLIIDEEQRFGVAVKERLKTLKANVDTLTLTATPIPLDAVLQFSLMGARDLSIINSPPPNRMPIVTEIHGFNEEIIKEGIEYEVARGGQVFVIHNMVENINEVRDKISRICPNVKVAVVHGQMDGNSIENVMFDFIREIM